MWFNPEILGIVNISEDSFSDGGKYLEPEKAISHCQELIKNGSHILDLGAASSHPNAKIVSAADEIKRLDSVLSFIQGKKIPISVDSFQPEVHLYVLKKQVEYINDIQGFPYPEIYKDIARSKCRLILMHSIQREGIADKRTTNSKTIINNIIHFFQERIENLNVAGIARERIILDPGMGFFLGSNPEPSLQILNEIKRLQQEFRLPILISVSRKSFLRNITGESINNIEAATLSAEMFAVRQGAAYIRTHDPNPLRQSIMIETRLYEQATR